MVLADFSRDMVEMLKVMGHAATVNLLIAMMKELMELVMIIQVTWKCEASRGMGSTM